MPLPLVATKNIVRRVLTEQTPFFRNWVEYGLIGKPSTGAKAPPFATQRRKALGMTRLATHPQETLLKAPAFEVLIELALDKSRQCGSLSRQLGLERVIMFFNTSW